MIKFKNFMLYCGSVILQLILIVRLIAHNSIKIVFSSIIVYILIQTFLFPQLPGYSVAEKWYANLLTSDKISFLILLTTIFGFFITLFTLSNNRKNESYTSIILSASDELHKTITKISPILNSYEFYFSKVLKTKLLIDQHSADKKGINFWIGYLAKLKDDLDKQNPQLHALVNDIYSISSKNCYINLLENVMIQQERLIDIATFVHLTCIDNNIIYKDDNTDHAFFAAQVNDFKTIYCLEVIRLARDCIARLSGYINGKFISNIAPTRALATLHIVRNSLNLVKESYSMQHRCIKELIKQTAEKNATDVISSSTQNKFTDLSI